MTLIFKTRKSINILMVVRRDSAYPLGFFNSQSSDTVPNHLADTVMEDLQIGEYQIKYRIRPVIFIRIFNWRENLAILRFDPRVSGSIILSDYREIIISEDEIDYYFDEDVKYCRIVLIGENGHSSFKIEFN